MQDKDGEARTEVRSGTAPSRPAPRFVAGQLLADRYRIIAELGHGGMGQVFRAEDTRLDQQVALKFLSASTATNGEMLERLAGEVRIGRGISHPNVCRVFDIVDTADGHHFLAMEFVEGEDLASLLHRIGRMTTERGVRLAHDICAGLAAAHDQGVIHRDLKPANIMVDKHGHARITDFGLAIGFADDRGGEHAGTPAYMAPEQLRGQAATTRSDIYALGLVLFEMFTGRRASGSSATAPSAIVRDLPADIDRAVLACLEETPASRPASARDVAAMLSPAENAAAVPGRVSGRSTSRSGDVSERSIAILPFEDLGGTGDDAFSAGLADEIISDLSKIKALRVISRGSVMRYRGTADLRLVGRELQVAFVLTGSVRRSGGQLRLNANLIDTHTDEIVWSDKFRGSTADIFDIQETVARTVAEQLRAQITAEESARIAERPISDPVAYEFYLRARSAILSTTPEGLASAGELLQSAEAIIGENAMILDAMAYREWWYFNSRIDPDEARLERAGQFAARIAALAPTATSAYRIRGLVAMSRGDSRRGVHELLYVAEHEPDDVDAMTWLVMLLAAAGRSEVALPFVDRLAKRDPYGNSSLIARTHFAWLCGDQGEALRLADVCQRFYPDALAITYVRAAVFLQMKRYEEAAAAYDALALRGVDNIFGHLGAFMAAVVRGRHDEAMTVFDTRVAPRARATLIHGAETALGLAGAGEVDAALDWMDNAITRGFLNSRHIECSPLADSLRGDPRFAALLETMRHESATFVTPRSL